MEALAEKFGMVVCTSLPTPPVELIDAIPLAFAKKHILLPIDYERVALADPLNVEALDELRLMLGRPMQGVYCKEKTLLPAIEEAYRHTEESTSKLMADMESRETHEEAYDLLGQTESAPAVKLINAILTEAIREGASDIHFEPMENSLRVRFRIDGVLVTRHTPPNETQLTARLKVMAGLDIAEHRLPQDGRIKLQVGGREIDLRVSTLPISDGERIVLRILDKGNIVLGLDKLGMPERLLNPLRDLIQRPEGILLVTGPTGSGKTTTLYSALTELASDDVNIMTIEDPVEYKLPGIAQIGVRPKIGLTFAAGLRHILRQDPDVIMIGEIRDRETAEIAIQSALTGHLVLSTLHTNDAPSAITRLVDMGIEPYLLSSSIVGILSQRLVRTLDNGEYKGRCGIYELMTVDDTIKQQICQSADAVAMRKLAISRGMSTLASQGAQLVAKGITTSAEIFRVTRGIE